MSERPTLMVVDDNAELLKTVTEFLRLEGYDSITAGSGREAIKCMADTTVDLVLTDVNMPDMDGLKLCRALRSKFPTLPIILMSGSAPVDRFQKVFERAGASDSITKPFRMAALVEMIQGLLKTPGV